MTYNPVLNNDGYEIGAVREDGIIFGSKPGDWNGEAYLSNRVVECCKYCHEPEIEVNGPNHSSCGLVGESSEVSAFHEEMYRN